VTFWRSNRDFSERDRLALQLLRPHLHEVYLDAERRRHGIPHLSRREREVLQLVALGYSNADIARALFISVATVAKHMEHIFDRTGVRTRSAAAALALPQASRFTGPVLSSTPR
jgi:DNA-binding CsgD family transcriptional regulator